MSLNIRSQVSQAHGSDPFLFCSKSEGLFDESRYSSCWNSPSQLSSYPSFDSVNLNGDQFCPTSGPSSPCNSLSPTENFTCFYPEDLCCSVKEEPLEELDHFSILLGDQFIGGLPALDALSEEFSDIPLQNPTNPPIETDFDARYMDFMQIFGTEAINQSSGVFSSTETFDAFMEVAESDSTPAGSVAASEVGLKRSSRLGAKASVGGRSKKPTTAAVVKKSAGNGSSAADFRGVCEKLNQLKNEGPATLNSLRRSAVSPSQSTTSSNSDEDAAGSSTPASSTVAQNKQSKRSSKSGSPEAYTRRREKNNIAVRKSREKKRQEIKKFAEEHNKLKREVDQIRAQNEKLRSLVTIVEDGIVSEKSRTELESLIKTAKKQLQWC